MERALSVSELNEYVRRLLAGDPLLRAVEVSGEISGYKHHVSGHRYFSLKDTGARVQCVMFRQNAMGLDFVPKDGMQVRVRASASLFSRDGSYQLYVSHMQKQGVGDLYQRFEELKAKLTREGLFDPAIKQPIPAMPKCVGIVTSRTGAAIRDMIRVARRRDPNVGIIVAPCAVQGAGAAEEIAAAIGRLNADGRPDVILCGRGGGSIEDLWAFNEEIVARAIAASRIPLISCVGHETDFTIADFAADMRAATPSMAAELAVPVTAELRQNLRAAMGRVQAALMQGSRVRRAELGRIWASHAFRDPADVMIRWRREQISRLWERAGAAETNRLRSLRSELDRRWTKVDALNPAGVLERGYACVRMEGRVLSSAKELAPGMRIDIRLRDGSARAEVLNTMVSEDDDGR